MERIADKKIKIKARLTIELAVDCPGCGNPFDLVADTYLNGNWRLFNQILPEGCWADGHDNFKCSAICPECWR